MNKTQDLVVLNILEKDGIITRNQCLNMFISRLGAIIHRLSARGQIQVTSRGYVEGDYEYVADVTNKKK